MTRSLRSQKEGRSDDDVDDFVTLWLRCRLTPKGTGSRADWAFCTKDKPCGEREGDCDGDDQCQAGLECGVDNCRAFHQEAHRLADCCVLKKGPGMLSITQIIFHLVYFIFL